ncbi:MAG: pyrroline-5-carboxylate reductase family protein [Bacteroidota bacterium]
MKSIGFIGGGRVATILLKGFEKAGVKTGQISVYDTSLPVLTLLEKEFPRVSVSATDPAAAAGSDLVLLALHPPVLSGSLGEISHLIKKDALVLSLAPKITLQALSGALPGHTRIARMIPNAASYSCKGFNPVAFHPEAGQAVKEDLLKLFSPLGAMPEVREDLLEAYAMISAMGHTYFWFQFQELLDLAIGFGMSREEAFTAVKEMLEGTMETYFNAGLSYEKLTDLVPVKPMVPAEEEIRTRYRELLGGLYLKIHP